MWLLEHRLKIDVDGAGVGEVELGKNLLCMCYGRRWRMMEMEK